MESGVSKTSAGDAAMVTKQIQAGNIKGILILTLDPGAYPVILE